MRRHAYLVSAGLTLAAFAAPNTEPIQREAGTSSDTDVGSVRAVRSSPMRIEEAPLFRIDPRRPPTAMIADIERRAIVAEAPRSLREEKPRR
jgi:hypothetical protein